MGNEGDTHVRERSHLQGPQLLANPSSLPSSPCLWPFLFNTIARSPLPTSSPSHCLSLSIYLFVYLSVCRSHFLCISFVCATWPNGFALTSMIYFLLQKQRGHAADCKWLVFAAQVAPPSPSCSTCMQSPNHAFYLRCVNLHLKQILKSRYVPVMCFILSLRIVAENRWIEPVIEHWEVPINLSILPSIYIYDK